MIRTWAELQTTPTEELIAEYDATSKHTSVGLNFYIGELHRRAEAERAIAMARMTRTIVRLTRVVTVMTALGVTASAGALIAALSS